MKVKYGLSKVYYAIATIAADGSATYAAPVAIPGAVSLSMEAQGNNQVFRADNTDYFTAAGGTGYSGDLEVALFPDSFRQDVLGEVVGGNGIQFEKLRPAVVHFALLFQFEDDVKNTRHVFYNCTASKPSVGSSTTPEGNTVEVQSESTTITAASIYVSAVDADVVKGRAKYGDSAYSDWFTAVTLPTAAASSGTTQTQGGG